MIIEFDFPAGAKVTATALGTTLTVDEWGDVPTSQTLSAYGGRVMVYDMALSDPSAGIAVPRSDGRTTLDLRDVTTAQTITADLGGGGQAEIVVAPITQQRGFGRGEYYWLAQDADGRFRPEPGRRHRKIHVSGSAAAMDLNAIAAHAGVAVGAVTGAWLAARPQYGGSTAMPVTDGVRKLITDETWGSQKASRSDWILYERGYSYDSNYFIGYLRGESELHPQVIGAWGSGPRPKFTRENAFLWIQLGPRYLLLRDLDIKAVSPKHGYGVILENCRISGHEESQTTEVAMVTMREVAIHDVVPDAPKAANAATWDGSNDRISGLFAANSNGLMFDSCLVDRNGWAEGYDYNRSVTMPYPPSDRNHGLYITFDCLDVHVRDSMISRNSSCGLQNRCGGQYERNLFADNNIAAGLHSGTRMGPVSQFCNWLDNVNFGAGYKKVNGYQGGINWGYDVTGRQSALLGNVMAHLANPDDPAEISARSEGNPSRPDWDGGAPYNTGALYIDNDTQVWAWRKSQAGAWLNERVDGLDGAALNQTTIQRYAGQVLGQASAPINALVEYMRDGAEYRIGQTVRTGVKWAKGRFGRPLPSRTAPADLVFRPDPRVEGFRWDNRYNWSTLDLPGMNIADTVDLDGAFVRFGTLTADIASLSSKGGTLDVTSGRLTAGSLADAAAIEVRNSGQLRLGATAQPVRIRASGGRVMLTGPVSDLDLEARGNAEILFGPDATVPAGRSLVVSGQRVLAGWDGTGSARLTVKGRLEFRAGIMMKPASADTLQKQRFMVRGRQIIGQTSGFTARIADYEEKRGADNWNELYLSDITGTPQPGERFEFGNWHSISDTSNRDVSLTAAVTATAARGIAPLQRFRSGALGDGLTEPAVAVSLVLEAGAQLAVQGRELLAAGTYDLTGPGITVTNQGATLPAGVTLTGGKLVYTVPA